MKKSQVLAALALAFALGVVAPVAMTVNNASAVDVTTPASKVTKEELQVAIDKAESNATYKAYSILNAAASKSDINENTYLTPLNSAIVTLNNKYTGDEVKTKLADALVVAKSTETAPKYAAFSNLYAAINNAQTKDFDNIQGLAEAAGLKVTLGNNEAKDVDALVTAIEANPAYKSYEALVEAVNEAEKAIESQDQNVTDLTSALMTWGYQQADVINTAAATPLKSSTDGPVTALKGLATAALNGKSDQKAKFSTLSTRILFAKLAASGNDEAQNATALNNLETAFYEATGLVLSSVTPSDPSDPSEGTGEGSNNGNDGEGEGDAAGDTDKTPEAGDTGVIAAADGTASSTVAIVAGIATALTAAGAGVVAYRNARRQEA